MDDAKTISLRLRRGIKIGTLSVNGYTVNFHNHNEATYSIHISVQVLVNYTAEAGVFALKANIQGSSNK